MRVLLAPMEGVLDSLVRELLTEVNDYDLCITSCPRGGSTAAGKSLSSHLP
ncbi:hypothetical protein GCM10029976_100000 [Kribbella albertanoniae]